MNFTVEKAKDWLDKTSRKINEQKYFLTALDRAIGDGDHGMNMARGFQAIHEALEDCSKTNCQTVADVFRLSARTLMTTVGGASGVLYATAFLQMAYVFQSETTITNRTFTIALEKAKDGIQTRGHANYGDKTLLDVWIEVVELFQQSVNFPKADALEAVAKGAMEKTKKSVAQKGKAALYEQHSVGHIDPGAASTYYLFASLAEVCKENEYE